MTLARNIIGLTVFAGVLACGTPGPLVIEAWKCF